MQATVKKLRQFAFPILVCMVLAACQKPYVSSEGSDGQIELEIKENCVPVTKNDGFIAVRAFVGGSGNKCLVRDLKQRNIWALDNGKNVGSPVNKGIVEFYQARNLNLDLQGHLVSGDPFENIFGVRAPTSNSEVEYNIKISNGHILTRGIYSIGVYMGNLWLGGWGAGDAPAAVEPYHEDGEPKTRDKSRGLHSLPHTYKPPTRFVAENLHVQSGGRGIVMVGADNVVRNNVIEVDGKVAVYLYGPRPTVEGNTFIVRLGEKDTTTLPAILKLRDADGAIIRNNKFIVKPDVLPWKTPGKAEAAINLLTSKNVLIENNTVMDTRQLLRKDESSTAEERGNVLQ